MCTDASLPCSSCTASYYSMVRQRLWDPVQMLSGSVTVLARVKCRHNSQTSCHVMCPASSAHVMLFHVVKSMLVLACAYMGPSDKSHTHQTNRGTVVCLQAILHPFTESWKTVGTTSNLMMTLCTSGGEPLRLCCMRSFRSATGWCRQM